MRPRIGLLGGSFDPIHCAHLALGHAAQQALHLDTVCFIPAGQPWQRAALCASPEHRLEMARLAIANEAGFTVDDREVRRDGPSYTVDTLEGWKTTDPDTDFFLILGGDQLRNFTSWHAWQRITQLAHLAVAQRADEPLAWPSGLDRETVHRIPMAPMAVSATDIRRRLTHGQEVAGLLPQKVLDYIARHKLYRNLLNPPA